MKYRVFPMDEVVPIEVEADGVHFTEGRLTFTKNVRKQGFAGVEDAREVVCCFHNAFWAYYQMVAEKG